MSSSRRVVSLADSGSAGFHAGGSRRGDESRQRILDAALRAFGDLGFKGATTRLITENAGASLPALKYYFDNKEGLYLACAGEIVRRYQVHMLDLACDAHLALSDAPSPAEARRRLKQVLGMLLELLVGSDKTEIWASFVLREIAQRGPAFDILYQQLWRPGLELTTRLIMRASGDQVSLERARLQALLLVSSLSAFSTARAVSLEYLEWPDAAKERFAAVRQIIEHQIDDLGPGQRPGPAGPAPRKE